MSEQALSPEPISSGPPPQTSASGSSESGGLTERAGAAAEGAKDVVGEAANQARNLGDEAKASVNTRSVEQRDRAADGLRSLSSQFQRMARQSSNPAMPGQSDNSTATKVVDEVARRTNAFADYLQDHEPDQLLEEVRGYARRHPGMFIGVAAGLGLVIGRATRAMTSSASSNNGASSGNQAYSPTVLGQQGTSGQPVTYGGGAGHVSGFQPSGAMSDELDDSFNGSMAGGRP